MKKKLFITAAILGVFLMLDIPLLAQETESSSSRSSSRSRSASRVYVPRAPAVPNVESIELMEFDHGYAYATTSSDKNSKLSLSKRYEGATTTKKGTFKVDNDVKKIRISVSGKVESGKIIVTIKMPDDKEVGTFQMDDTADVHWSQSINVDDEETRYYGDWTFVIKADQAHGMYTLSLSTY
jgi:hypothetical protein